MNRTDSNPQTNLAIEIIECRTGEVLHSIRVPVEYWMDDVDRASAINERVLLWCGARQTYARIMDTAQPSGGPNQTP